jgi:hypothetical protein
VAQFTLCNFAWADALSLSLLIFPFSNLIASCCIESIQLGFGVRTVGRKSSDRAELFGGYSYAARDFSSGTIGNGGLKRGWNASLNLKFSRVLGFVSDFGGHYNHQNSGGVCAGGVASCSSSAYTAMGPQVSLPLPKITPFAHALFGIAHAIQNGTTPVNPFQGNNSFVAALGGGLDYHLTRHFALRGRETTCSPGLLTPTTSFTLTTIMLGFLQGWWCGFSQGSCSPCELGRIRESTPEVAI